MTCRKSCIFKILDWKSKLWINRIYFFFFANHRYDDMSLSTVLHRSYLLCWLRRMIGATDHMYVNMESVYVYILNARRPKAFWYRCNFVYTRMTRIFNDDDQCGVWKRKREMITETVWRDNRGGGDSCYHFPLFKQNISVG
jgi:hypothetical protein